MSSNPAIQLTKARSLAQAGKTSAARKAYKSCLGPRPTTDVLIEFAMFEANGGHLANARKLLVKAKQLAPNNPDIYINLGEIYRLTKNYQDAAVSLRRACELTKNEDADALYLLAEAERSLGELEQAEIHAQAAHTLAPGDVDIAISQALIQIAKGAPHLAIDHYQKALEIAPQRFETASNLALLLFQNERWHEAAAAFAAASKLAPISNHHILNWIDALIYVERGSEALDVLETFDRTEIDQTTLHLALSSALISVGRFDDAEIHLREILKADAPSAVAYEKLSTLNKLKAEDETPLRALAESAKSNQERMRANFALYHLLKKST
ncbi:MAG: tetratricopeptide repeat protein, partial [Hyphomicrobiales bacterium]